jgi:hypothetical protein
MYTKFDDLNMIKKIRMYMSNNPDATRQEVCENCVTNPRRLKMLEQEGYLGIPQPMARGARNKKYYEDKAVQPSST